MVNKVILIGNLGSDPELKYTTAGTAVANFNIATTERWKGKDGTMQESTEWHRIVAWDRLGEICGEYLTKGSKVYIEGKLSTRKYQAQDGTDRYTTEIVARDMKMLGGKSDNSGGGHSEPQGPGFPDDNGTGSDVPF